MSVTPIRPGLSHPAKPLELPLLPQDAATVVAGTPVTAFTLDGEQALVLPLGALIEEDSHVTALPLPSADALRVAAGQSTRARTFDGRDLVVRPPTIDELITLYTTGASDGDMEGRAAMPPLSRERAEQLLRPLDLAELAATLVNGGVHGSTYIDRTALVLRLAGHEDVPPIDDPDETALLTALMPAQAYSEDAAAAMARILAGAEPRPGYKQVGHQMLADLEQVKRLLRHVRMDLEDITRHRPPRV